MRPPSVLWSTVRRPQRRCSRMALDEATGAAAAPPADVVDLEAVLRNGTGVARRVLSDPDIEGDPLTFLKATEAYWKVGAKQSMTSCDMPSSPKAVSTTCMCVIPTMQLGS